MQSMSNVRGHDVIINKFVILGIFRQEPSDLRRKMRGDVIGRSVGVLKVKLIAHQPEGPEDKVRLHSESAWLHRKPLRDNYLHLE
jgi:hypothetical protein